MARLALKDKYEKEIRPALVRDLGLKSPMAAPRLTKVVINMGTGDKLKDKENKSLLMEDLAVITGQKPKVQKARVSVAGFALRQGQPVGLTVTLRRDRMYNFLDKLISVTLPRLRDFRGIPLKSFDKAGNYTLGIQDYSVFPEIDLGRGSQGMEITVVTSTDNKDHAKRLLELIGMPFEKEEKN